MAQTIKLKRSGTSGAVPTTSQLELGEVAINTYDGKMYIKKNVGGTESIVEVTVAAADAIVVEYQFTATANQTTFSGSDDNSETLSYSAGAVQIFLNGILLDSGVDYTATNGTSIVLSEVVDANDYLQVFAFKKKISNGQTTVDTFTGDNSTTAFTLSLDPGDENNTRVYIDGVYQSKSNYSVSGTTLTFSTAPPTGTAIEVEIGNRVVTLDTLSDLDLPDDVKLRLGTSQDLQIYHNGSNSYIVENGTGDLFLGATNLRLTNGSVNSTYLEGTNGGAVNIRYNNSVKLETSNDGVTVTGDVEADEFIGDVRGAVLFKAQAGEALSKGDVVYISGISGNTTIVSKADADDASKMPAFGLVAAAASSGNPVDIYTNGILSGIDTSSYSEGDELFVSTTAGALTATAPTGESAALQKIGKVTRSASSGSIFIVGAGRSNAVPNLDDGDIFIGNASNQAVSASLNTKIEDYLDGGTSTPTFAGLTTTANVSFGDNDKAIFGAGSDLQIYHSSVDSFVNDLGTGSLYLGSNGAGVNIYNPSTSEFFAKFNADGAVQLYYDNAQKLATTSTGIDVTGTVLSDGLRFGTATDHTIKWGSGAEILGIGSNDQTIHIRLDPSDASNFGYFQITDGSSDKRLLLVDDSGDISFYEDTGTDAKFFWDSSEESLTIGGGSTTQQTLRVTGAHASALSTGFDNQVFKVANTSASKLSGIDFIAANTNGDAGTIARIGGFNTSSASYLGEITLSTRDGTGMVERVRIDDSGNVGIGTSSPSQKLDVNGIIVSDNATNGFRATEGFSGAYYSQFSSNLNSGTTSVDTLIDSVAGTGWAAQIMFRTQQAGGSIGERMRINSSGNVGIGTINPSGKLDVAGNVYLANYSGTGENQTILAQNDYGQMRAGIRSGIPYIGSITSLDFALYTGNSEKVRIDTSGNVGIGTSSPSNLLTISDATAAKLELNRNGSIGNGWIVSTDNAANEEVAIQMYNSEFRLYNNSTQNFTVTSAGNVGIGTTSPADRLHISGGHLLLNNAIEIRSKDTGGNVRTVLRANSSNELEYGWSANAPVKFMGGGSYTERMRIHTNGNIGIGTTSPSEKLTVAGPIGVSATGYTANATTANFGLYTSGLVDTTYIQMPASGQFQVWKPSTGAVVTVLENGNMGIGTSSPAFITGSGLEVQRDGVATLRLEDTGSSGKALELSIDDSTGAIINSGSSGLPMIFKVINSEAMRLDTSGNVGIGTTSPSQKLDVSGRIKSSDGLLSNAFQVYNTGTTGFLIELDVASNNYAHIHGTIKLQQFNVSSQQIIDFSATTLNNGTVQSSAATADIDVTIKLFVYNSKWYVHVPSPSTYSDISAYIHLGAGYQGGSRGSNCIVNVTSAAVPSSGVTGSVDIVAQKRVLANTAGNVGVGETSPNAKFHVKDTLNSTGVAGSATPIAILQNERLNTGSGTAVLRFDTNEVSGTSQFQRATIGAGWDGSGNYRGFLAFATNDTNNALQERMRIRHDGNVGIGTSAPVTSLSFGESSTGITFLSTATNFNSGKVAGIRGEVGGTGYGNLAFDTFQGGNGGGERMMIRYDGNVGIGTSSPTSQLQVNVGTNLNLGINEDSSTVRLSAYNDAASASVPMTINSSSTRFDISDSEAMRIDSSGNLLVGKTSTNIAVDGCRFGDFGAVLTRGDGSEPLRVNRTSSDGEIIKLDKDGSTVGSISTSGGLLVIGDSDCGIAFEDGTTNHIYPWNVSGGAANNDAISLGANGAAFKDLYLSGEVNAARFSTDSDGIKLATGMGIKFGPHASTNILDDYEEGTWTPTVTTVSGFTVGASPSYSGTYVKVGKKVFIAAKLDFDASENIAVGDYVQLGGMPFTPVHAFDGEGVFHLAVNASSDRGATGLAYNISNSLYLWTTHIGSGPQQWASQAYVQMAFEVS